MHVSRFLTECFIAAVEIFNTFLWAVGVFLLTVWLIMGLTPDMTYEAIYSTTGSIILIAMYGVCSVINIIKLVAKSYLKYLKEKEKPHVKRIS